MNKPKISVGALKDDVTVPSRVSPKNDDHFYTLAIAVSVVVILVLELFSALHTSEVFLSALASACCAFSMSGDTKYRRAAIVLYVFSGLPYLSGTLFCLSVIPLLFCRNK